MVQNCHCKLKSIYCPFQRILPYNIFHGNRGYKLSKQTRKNVYCTKFQIANFDSKQYRKKKEKNKFSFILMSHVKVTSFTSIVKLTGGIFVIPFTFMFLIIQCEIQISPNLVCRRLCQRSVQGICIRRHCKKSPRPKTNGFFFIWNQFLASRAWLVAINKHKCDQNISTF